MSPRRPSARKRAYRQIARADSTRETERRILEAATKLFAENYYDEVTLDLIAESARVSSKTVQRTFGTKEALAARFIEAAGRHDAAVRDAVPTGDVDAALATILQTYETFGDSILRTLSLDGRIAMVSAMAERGRELHSAWIARVFAPLLPRSPARRKSDLGLLVVATDVFTWKLLRRDRGFSARETARAVRQLVSLILSGSPNNRAAARGVE